MYVCDILILMSIPVSGYWLTYMSVRMYFFPYSVLMISVFGAVRDLMEFFVLDNCWFILSCPPVFVIIFVRNNVCPLHLMTSLVVTEDVALKPFAF